MDSIYKIIDIVGTSKTSWEEAAKNAVGDRRKVPGRPEGRGGRQTGHGDRQEQGRRLPGTGEHLLQVSRVAATRVARIVRRPGGGSGVPPPRNTQ